MGGGHPATSSTNVIDLDSSSAPKYKAGPPLRAAKVYVSCVQLPDGSVVELGGGSANKIENASQEVSMLKTPTSTSWTPMNPLPTGEHRLYHSMAFLADDGSIISLSSNPKGQARSDTVLQFRAALPVQAGRHTCRPADLGRRGRAKSRYGQTYSIDVSSDVTKVIMMTPASPTHSFDANQREIPLQYADGKITINATSSLAPRGYYRLFAINDKRRYLHRQVDQVEVARTGALIRSSAVSWLPTSLRRNASKGSVCVAPGADHGLKFVPGGLDFVDVGEAHDPYQTSVPLQAWEVALDLRAAVKHQTDDLL